MHSRTIFLEMYFTDSTSKTFLFCHVVFLDKKSLVNKDGTIAIKKLVYASCEQLHSTTFHIMILLLMLFSRKSSSLRSNEFMDINQNLYISQSITSLLYSFDCFYQKQGNLSGIVWLFSRRFGEKKRHAIYL